MNEEKLTLKKSELDAVLKEKSCRNCAICLEGHNSTFKDQIDLITNLNKSLNKKRQENDGLLETINSQSKLLANISQNSF